MRKRVFSLLLALLLVLQAVPGARAAAGQDSTADVPVLPKGEGTFCFVAATSGAMVVAPTEISYAEGQTIRQALQSSSYDFAGLDGEFVSSIAGVAGNYSRYDERGGFDLDVPAAGTACFMFVGIELTEETAPAFAWMVSAMAAYNRSENGVQKYAPAQEAYRAAGFGIFQSEAAHGVLAKALEDAMTAYETEILQGERVPLALEFRTLAGEALTAYTFTAQDTYDNAFTFTQAEQAALRAGDYTFVLTGDTGRAYGEMTVAADGTVTVAGEVCDALCLYDGAWIGAVKLHSTSGGDAATDLYPAEGDTYYIPDTVGEIGDLYIYLEPGAGIDGETYTTGNVSCYVPSGREQSPLHKPWKSNFAALTYVLSPGMAGRTVTLEARHAYGGYTVVQTRELRLERTPTLSALSVTADGVAQEIGFSPEQEDYSLTVSAAAVSIVPTAFGEMGYTVTVDGEAVPAGGEKRIPLLSAETTVEIDVSLENGRTKTYLLVIRRVEAEIVTLRHTAGTAVQVYNAAGAEIGAADAAETASTYALVPGETYTYISTRDGYYHATSSFQAAVGLTVTAAEPDTADLLESLQLRNRYSAQGADIYLEGIQKERHAYTAEVVDAYGVVYAAGAVGEGCTLRLAETGTAVSAGGTMLRLTPGGTGQTLTFQVVWQQDGVEYYQDYLVEVQRRLTLEDMVLAVDGEAATLFQVEDGAVTTDQQFDGEVYHYQANILRSAQSAALTLRPFSEDYYLTVNGTRYDLPQDPETGEQAQAVTVSLPLDSAVGSEMAAVQVCCAADGAVSQTYTVDFVKSDPVLTRFTVRDTEGQELPDALVVVHDLQAGSRIWPAADGSFALVSGMEYRYVATYYDYVGQAVESFWASEENAEVSIVLARAPERTGSEGISSSWPSFRGSDDANGVVAAKTPITAETAVLSWANKLGDGYSSAAVSCPILITEDGYDYLIVYAGEKLFKVDALSGIVVAEGVMDRSSSFAINSPTYAEGMIFVGLSNGGVQAFDARTLESLWLYTDVLGGQPNCPITYHGGYIYTGFWNSETANANYVCLAVTDEDPDQAKEAKLPTWTYTSKGGFYWAGCYVSDDYLLVGTDDGDDGYLKYTASLLCLDPGTGELLDSITGLRGDVRSNVSRAGDRFYFTSKGGYFYSAQVDTAPDGTVSLNDETFKAVYLDNGGNDENKPPMSTCTPVIYNGRAYIGVSGTAQFGAYSGHNITVIDLSAWQIAYSVPTQGYPQTSGLLTTAYGDAYVYFFDNFTPGKLRLLRDRPGQTEADRVTPETYTESGAAKQINAAYALFTPVDSQAQYAICSPIVDGGGTIYFKNDSAQLMALTNTIEKLEVVTQPEKTAYQAGEAFDSAGMTVKITYTNGESRTLPASRTVNGETIPYFTWAEEALAADPDTVTEDPATGEKTGTTDVIIRFPYTMYQNCEGAAGVAWAAPTASVTVTVQGGSEPEVTLGDVNGDGDVTNADVIKLRRHILGLGTLAGEQLQAADVNQDGDVTNGDLIRIRRYVLGLVGALS